VSKSGGLAKAMNAGKRRLTIHIFVDGDACPVKAEV